MRKRRVAALTTLAAISVGLAAVPAIGTGDLELVSVETGGVDGRGHTGLGDMSSDGRWVVFHSQDGNFVEQSPQSSYSVLRDRKTGKNRIVGSNQHVDAPNDTIFHRVISSDGRYVAYDTWATNLHPDDTTRSLDVYLWDTTTGENVLVSTASNGGVRGDGLGAGYPSISADGRYVAFTSKSSELVSGDHNGTTDVFIWDRDSGRNERIPVTASGYEGDGGARRPIISSSGRYVYFQSEVKVTSTAFTRAMHLYRHDRETGDTVLVSVDSQGRELATYSRGNHTVALADDGRYVAFVAGPPVSDPDGEYRRLLLRDMDTGEIWHLWEDVGTVSMSSDGRLLVFSARLGPDGETWDGTPPESGFGGHQVVRLDWRTGAYDLVSANPVSGALGDEDTFLAISDGEGREIAFSTEATNLVDSDDRGRQDVFVRHMGSLQPGRRFADVGPDHVFHDDIDWLAASGITKGCNPPLNDLYCPDSPVTRGQMAAFLHRAFPELTTGSAEDFNDTSGTVFAEDIAWLAQTGVTKGCDPPANTRFCPDEPVARGEMAAFLTRALDLTPAESPFSDDDFSVFEDDIAALVASGITKGCNPPANTHFCPDESVSRGQMAAFLHRAADS